MCLHLLWNLKTCKDLIQMMLFLKWEFQSLFSISQRFSIYTNSRENGIVMFFFFFWCHLYSGHFLCNLEEAVMDHSKRPFHAWPVKKNGPLMSAWCLKSSWPLAIITGWLETFWQTVTLRSIVPVLPGKDWETLLCCWCWCVLMFCSDRLLFEDNESGLFSVTLFRKAIDDFKHKARENK